MRDTYDVSKVLDARVRVFLMPSFKVRPDVVTRRCKCEYKNGAWWLKASIFASL